MVGWFKLKIVLESAAFSSLRSVLADEDKKLQELYEFGPFRVDPGKEVLLRAGEPVPLTPKTFQVLLVLVRHHQEIVSKDDLMKAVWPDTFVEEANLSRNIFMLRKALGDNLEDQRYIITVPGRGYRFAENVRLAPAQEVSIVAAQHSKVQVRVKETKPWAWLSVIAVVLLGVAVGATWLLLHRKPLLSEKDTVVLADFANSTGDPVFDDTLRQGLALQLEQSSFLALVSDAWVQQTLPLMGQPADARLTPTIAYDLCQRTQSAAVIEGSIANLGSQYVLGLRAVSCRTGDSLDEEQARASGKEQVLAAMDKAAAKLREKLGESRTSLERFDTPLEQASTPSMAALQAYTLGRKTQLVKNNFPEAVPFYQRAIRLDPNFAIAYAALGSVYWNIGESTLGTENARKAYDLRARVSEPERFYIESTYYHYATGELEKARQIYEVWSQTYPRSASPRTRLFALYSDIGQWDKALAATREAQRLDPAQGLPYSNLAYAYLSLNRLEEARATTEEAETKNPNSYVNRFRLYQIAFLENDVAGMARQIQWAAEHPTVEDAFLEAEAETAAYFGQLGKSRDFSHRAVTATTQTQRAERGAVYHASAALREALYGNTTEARFHAGLSIGLSRGRDPEYGAALALAFSGDAAGAEKLANDLAKRFPEDSLVQFNYLPTLRAELSLRSKEPSKAIAEVQVAAPYELGYPGRYLSLYPVYVRAEAYLAAQQAGRAASEFQKIVDHRGVVSNEPIAALAHLGLARAHALQAKSAQGTDADAARSQARADYRDFLSLWKDADPDIPILKQAKSEYAKLQLWF